MTDYILPPDLIASDAEWSLIDNTAVYDSALSGAIRTYSRPGNRWSVRLSFRSVSDAKRRRLMAILSILRGRSNRIWLTDPSHSFSGALACPELLSNNSPTVNTTGWSSSNAELTLAADSHLGLRLSRASVTGDRYAYQPSFTTVASANYAVRSVAVAGKGALRYSVDVGTSQGANGLLDGPVKTTAGKLDQTFTASGTSAHLSIYDYISGRTAGDFQFINYISAARCGLVNGADQVGGALNVDGLPVSTNGVARAGDWVEVGGELKRLVADLNTDSSGAGYLIFEPTLRSSPADNAPVIFRNPMGRFLIDGDTVSWSSRPGVISDFSIALIEDIA